MTDTKELINKLNTAASHYEKRGLYNDGISEAAIDYDLIEIAEEGNCRIYATPDGTLINAWIEGGRGFDDQVEWYSLNKGGGSMNPENEPTTSEPVSYAVYLMSKYQDMTTVLAELEQARQTEEAGNPMYSSSDYREAVALVEAWAKEESENG